MHSLWVAHIREVTPNADEVACIFVEGVVLFSLLEFLLFSRGERFLLNDDGFSFFAFSELRKKNIQMAFRVKLFQQKALLLL